MGLVVARGGDETFRDRFTRVMLCCVFKRETEKSSCYHLGSGGQAYWCVCYVPYMQPWCVDFSLLFYSWQFIRFSSRSQGWAIIKPHQAWRGNHSWAFFSHGVFSQWQAHWLCSLGVRLSPVLRRHTYAQIETGGDRRRVRHIGLVHL